MRQPVRNFLVGTTSIVALLGFASLLLLFGELDRFIRPRYVLTIHTDHAAGLRPGSSVELNGVPIGVVDKVVVQDSASNPVKVTTLISRDIQIPAGARPFAATSLLGGASILQMEAAPLPVDTGYLPNDGSASITSSIPFRMVEQITAELDSRMTPVMEALLKFDELSQTYITLGESLNELVRPQGEDTLSAGEQPNLHTAVARVNDVLETARQALELSRDWLDDEQMRSDARTAVSKASTLIDKTSETMDRFTQLAGSLESDSDQLVKRLLPVADEMAATLEEVRRVTSLASEGDGSVALFLNNPDLYNSLDDAAIRLDKTLKELTLFIQKAKAEGLPIDPF